MLPLDYVIDLDDPPGRPGRTVEGGFDCNADVPGAAETWFYVNLLDQHEQRIFDYLPRVGTAADYKEDILDPAKPGFKANVREQLDRRPHARVIELDNPDSYRAQDVIRAHLFAVSEYGDRIALKNPHLKFVDGDSVSSLLSRPEVVAAIVEEDDDATASRLHGMRLSAGKPDLPIYFVAFGSGRAWAERIAAEIRTNGYRNMAVTFDAAAKEYGGEIVDLVLPQISSPDQPQGPAPMTVVTGAQILAEARSYIGRFHDGADVPDMARKTAAAFPDDQELARYVTEASNDMPWCGDFVGFVLSRFGIKPPPVKNGVGHFYVDRWLDFGSPIPVGQEQAGDVCLFIYPGTLHHVTFVAGGGRYVGGNQSDAVTDTKFGATPSAIRRPPVVGASLDPHPLIALGATGAPVVELQRLLGIPQTGAFDSSTDVAVRAYQSAHGLDVDGEVGPDTWPALLGGAAPISGPTPLPPDIIDRIAALAGSSALARYSWNDRGRAPVGYIKGMTVSFARVYAQLKAGDSSARVMAALPTGDTAHDALAWYGVTNITAGASTLRALFALLIGLGIRESSGNCFEGRDTSASNVAADTAEAGLFQQSWNSHVASPELPKLFSAWSADGSDGLLSIFREGLSGGPSANFGSGDGAAFQALCKSKPLFAVCCAGVGLRTIRSHWGPIIRREAELLPEAASLLLQVQTIVDAINGVVLPPIKPDPTPPPQPNPQNPLLIAAALALFLMEQRMSASQPFDLSKIFAMVNNPILQKLFGGGAVTLDELKSLGQTELAILFGQTPPALLPPTPPIDPAAPVSVPASPASTPSTTPDWLKNLSAGIALVATSLGLSATGVIGAPVGPEATTTGMLLPLISAGAAAFGIPAPLINIISSLFGAVNRARATKPPGR